jgi:hypothetical protein
METQQMHDVQLLVQNLINHEEATIKLIIDSLYDVGSVNLINQKFLFRPVNRTIKRIAQMSKPMFRLFAWYWVKKNCANLITNWLKSRIIRASTPQISPQKTEVTDIKTPLENPGQEIKYLRYQVRLLTATTIIAFCSLGVTVALLKPISPTSFPSQNQVKSLIYPQ